MHVVCHVAQRTTCASIAQLLCSLTGIVLIVLSVLLILVGCVLCLILVVSGRRRRERVLTPQPAKGTRTGSTPDFFQPTNKLHPILPAPTAPKQPPAFTSDASSSGDTLPATPVQPMATPRSQFPAVPQAEPPITPRMDAFEHPGHAQPTFSPAPQPWLRPRPPPGYRSNVPVAPEGGPQMQAGPPLWPLPSDAMLHMGAVPSRLPAGPASLSAARRGRYVMCRPCHLFTACCQLSNSIVLLSASPPCRDLPRAIHHQKALSCATHGDIAHEQPSHGPMYTE